MPVLYAGEFSRTVVNEVMARLKENGSSMVPGFMKPEGVVIYLAGPRVLLKETFDNPNGKWADAALAA